MFLKKNQKHSDVSQSLLFSSGLTWHFIQLYFKYWNTSFQPQKKKRKEKQCEIWLYIKSNTETLRHYKLMEKAPKQAGKLWKWWQTQGGTWTSLNKRHHISPWSLSDLTVIYGIFLPKLSNYPKANSSTAHRQALALSLPQHLCPRHGLGFYHSPSHQAKYHIPLFSHHINFALLFLNTITSV